MTELFADYLSKYMKQHANRFNQYLTAAFENNDHSIRYLETGNNEQDIRNLELLCDANLFKENLQLSRSGRNFYRCFQLTEIGLKYADGLKHNKLDVDAT